MTVWLVVETRPDYYALPEVARVCANPETAAQVTRELVAAHDRSWTYHIEEWRVQA